MYYAIGLCIHLKCIFQFSKHINQVPSNRYAILRFQLHIAPLFGVDKADYQVAAIFSAFGKRLLKQIGES